MGFNSGFKGLIVVSKGFAIGYLEQKEELSR